MPEVHTVDGDRADGVEHESLGDLVGRLTSEMELLIREEIALARLEMSHQAKSAAAGAALFGVAAGAVLFAVGALVAAAILGLSTVLTGWLAALLVGVGLLLAAVLLALWGRGRLRSASPPVPTQTLESLREDVRWIRHKSRS